MIRSEDILPKETKALFSMVRKRHPLSLSSLRFLFPENAELDNTCISVLSEKSRIPNCFNCFNAAEGIFLKRLLLRSRASKRCNPEKAASDNSTRLLDDKSSSRRRMQHPPLLSRMKVSSAIESM